MRGTDKMKKTDIQGENESSEIRAGSAETKKTEPGEDRLPEEQMQDIVEPGKRNYWKGMPFLIGAVAAVSIMAGVKWYENNDVKDVSQTEAASEEMGIAFAMPDTEKAGSKETEKKTEAYETETELPEKEKKKYRDEGAAKIKSLVFMADEGGISPYMTITGLTEKERRDTGFIEADFLNKAGLYLKDRGISTKRIIVENPIDCSCPDGKAFQARLEGKEKYNFQFIVFPSIKGQYIFTLQEKEKEVQPESLQTTETMAQSNVQAQTTQTDAYQTNTPQANTSQTQPATSDYDATRLSISSIPNELYNYLDNEYTFQYSLYSYLYNAGKKNVSSAAVVDYSIDGGTKTASMKIQLDDGSVISGTYSKGTNSYSFT